MTEQGVQDGKQTFVLPRSTVAKLCKWCCQVNMDRYMGCVSNELATITGPELTVAPCRPAHMTYK